MQEKQNKKERRYNFCLKTIFMNLTVNSVSAVDLISCITQDVISCQFLAIHLFVSGYINCDYNSSRSLKRRLQRR